MISIHVPAWGTTDKLTAEAAGILFQSTCPRGARLRFAVIVQWVLYFNPRARVGHDLLLRHISSSAAFQSTCPRGARQCDPLQALVG